MKNKIIAAVTLLLVVSMFAGCGSKTIESNPQETPLTQTEESEMKDTPEAEDVKDDTSKTEKPVKEDLPEVSKNEDVVTSQKAPKVFVMTDVNGGEDSITYHLENCARLKGRQTSEIAWELVQMIGYWQCPECNPPRYENYKNAN